MTGFKEECSTYIKRKKYTEFLILESSFLFLLILLKGIINLK